MRSIRELAAMTGTGGRLETIVVRGAPRQPARTVQQTMAIAAAGLADDRLGQRDMPPASGRQVTLIQHEHLPVIAQLAGVAAVDALQLRRNLVVSGVNLLALKGRLVRVGEALLEIVGPCHPCSRMEDEIGPGGYAAMRGHGGMTARVLRGGAIAVGAAVSVAAPSSGDEPG